MSKRSITEFNRWLPHGGVTIAYKLFKKDLEEVNDFCWHGQGAANHVEKLLATATPTHLINTLVNYGNDPGRRADTLIIDAKKIFPDVENWIRLSTVICVASLFELYVRRIVALTLESDPGILIYRPKVVDGVELLKHNVGENMSDHINSCTVGTWSAREVGLARVFGGRVDAVYDNLKELQAIQTMRNSIAHDFARTSKSKDFWYLVPSQSEPEPVTRISAARLQNFLRVVSLVAQELEALALKHVGAFELFKFWHLFKIGTSNSENKFLKKYISLYRSGGSRKLLSSYSATITGNTIGREYCRALLNHYDKY